jgi:hypothetical protein
MRWVFLVFLIGLVPTAFVAPAFPPYAPVGQLTFLESLSELATIAIVQIYRYRRVSSPLQRQQTKWVVFGIAASITVVVIGSVPLLIFPTLAEPGSLYPVALNAFSTLGPLFIPLSFGFAMLHSRLWDIDVLINRTLVYGTLTVILAVIYVGLVIGLQALLRSIISQDNSVPLLFQHWPSLPSFSHCATVFRRSLIADSIDASMTRKRSWSLLAIHCATKWIWSS